MTVKQFQGEHVHGPSHSTMTIRVISQRFSWREMWYLLWSRKVVAEAKLDLPCGVPNLLEDATVDYFRVKIPSRAWAVEHEREAERDRVRDDSVPVDWRPKS